MRNNQDLFFPLAVMMEMFSRFLMSTTLKIYTYELSTGVESVITSSTLPCATYISYIYNNYICQSLISCISQPSVTNWNYKRAPAKDIDDIFMHLHNISSTKHATQLVAGHNRITTESNYMKESEIHSVHQEKCVTGNICDSDRRYI